MSHMSSSQRHVCCLPKALSPWREETWPAELPLALPPSTLAQDLLRLLTEQIDPDFEVVVQDEAREAKELKRSRI